MAAPKIKHLYSTSPRVDEAWKTECGLSTMRASTSVVRSEAKATCEDCKRIKAERHAKAMETDTSYRRRYELIAGFAEVGIGVGKYGPISMSFTDATKVLRRLKRAHRD